MEQSRLYELIDAYSKGTCSSAEREELLQWYRRHANVDGEYPDIEEEVFARMLLRLLEETNYCDKAPHRLTKWLPYTAAAAILISFFTFAFYKFLTSEPGIDTSVSVLPQHDNQATLTLADGSIIALHANERGISLDSNGVHYLGVEQPNDIIIPTDKIGNAMLVLATPRGRTYQVSLSDGTKVTLNASTTLKYPAHFSDQERTVELSGEAFFEVSSKSMDRSGKKVPFVVLSQGQKVQVLGTKFNVSTYSEDKSTKTTLVEGLVSVQQTEGQWDEGPDRQREFTARGPAKKIKPGEQTVLENKIVTIRTVDLFSELAWRQGRFSFEGKRFDEVFNELARWYDIELEFVGGVPKDEFYGGAFRDDNISVILNMLESVGLKYKMEDRKLIIYNKEKEGNNR